MKKSALINTLSELISSEFIWICSAVQTCTFQFSSQLNLLYGPIKRYSGKAQRWIKTKTASVNGDIFWISYDQRWDFSGFQHSGRHCGILERHFHASRLKIRNVVLNYTNLSKLNVSSIWKLFWVYSSEIKWKWSQMGSQLLSFWVILLDEIVWLNSLVKIAQRILASKYARLINFIGIRI